MEKTIKIPEGYEARIEGNKVILERKESEDERIREVIESIVRVYGKTQGEWLAGYDMDTLVVHLRDAFAYLERQKEQKPAEWGKGDKENLIVDFLVSLGYPIDANGNIPNYNETFESCKSALVYWLQQNLQKMLANKRIEPDGIKTETLLKDSYIQAYREGIEDSIRELSSQCENSSSQPHWKPSEEQMWALDVALENFYDQNDRAALDSLRIDLQKLL